MLRPKKLLIVMNIIVITIILCLWYQSSALDNINLQDRFKESTLTIQSNNLFDIGVVDYNDDGVFDIFTVNHHSRQSLLRGGTDGVFVDTLSAVGLDHQPEFPAVEITSRPPIIKKPGFYIYWQNTGIVSGIVLNWIPSENAVKLSGQMTLSSSVKISDNLGFALNIEQIPQPNGMIKTVIDFTATSEGKVNIETYHIAIPVNFKLANDIPLQDIHVGQYLINPSAHAFTIFLNDRHGMAWADYNSDGQMDVFITRGGLRGKMALFSEEFQDELFEGKSGKFFNVINKTGITKNSCPGYNVQWIDYNRDNNLDLYIACHHNHKNMLYKNNGDGTFSNIAGSLGLDSSNYLTDTPFVWLDADNDGKLDLFLVGKDGLQIYLNNLSEFKLEKTFPISSVNKITLSDFDLDGDIDMFVAAYGGMNSFLINNGTEFSLKAAHEMGLTSTSLFANWVDYDNDGLPDLHVIPGGLYRQQPDHTFKATGILKHKFQFMKRARSSWCDLDNDGDRDLIMAIYYEDPLWKILINAILGRYTPNWVKLRDKHGEWVVRAFINDTNNQVNVNHWLQLKLTDIKGNAHAIGALVTLERNNHKIAAQVGQAEGSIASQGHYRLYFGLGNDPTINLVKIQWPDGSYQETIINDVDRLVEIQRSSEISKN